MCDEYTKTSFGLTNAPSTYQTSLALYEVLQTSNTQLPLTKISQYNLIVLADLFLLLFCLFFNFIFVSYWFFKHTHHEMKPKNKCIDKVVSYEADQGACILDVGRSSNVRQQAINSQRCATLRTRRH